MGKLKAFRAPLRLAAGATASFATMLGLSACGQDTQALGRDYDIVFSVTSSSGDIGALQFEVRTENGQFLGRDDQVDCSARVDAIAAGNYVGEAVVKLGLISLNGIDAPTAILECGLRSRETPEIEDFDIDVTDASDTNSQAIAPEPDVEVTAITPR